MWVLIGGGRSCGLGGKVSYSTPSCSLIDLSSNILLSLSDLFYVVNLKSSPVWLLKYLSSGGRSCNRDEGILYATPCVALFNLISLSVFVLSLMVFRGLFLGRRSCGNRGKLSYPTLSCYLTRLSSANLISLLRLLQKSASSGGRSCLGPSFESFWTNFLSRERSCRHGGGRKYYDPIFASGFPKALVPSQVV